MAFHQSDTLRDAVAPGDSAPAAEVHFQNGSGANRFEAAAGPSGVVPDNSESAGVQSETDLEAEYQKSIQALLQRACELTEEAENDPPGQKPPPRIAPAKPPAPPSSPAGVFEPQCSGDGPGPRMAAPETAATLQAMRDLAVSSARDAVGRHSSRRLVQSARQNLWMAFLALISSLMLQCASTSPSSTAFLLALASLMVAVPWAVRYLCITRELNRQLADMREAGCTAEGSVVAAGEQADPFQAMAAT